MQKFTFEKNDPAGETGYYIADGGTYNAEDLVPCKKQIDDEKATVSYQANYLATGQHI
jgi:hypothetical protein